MAFCRVSKTNDARANKNTNLQKGKYPSNMSRTEESWWWRWRRTATDKRIGISFFSWSFLSFPTEFVAVHLLPSIVEWIKREQRREPACLLAGCMDGGQKKYPRPKGSWTWGDMHGVDMSAEQKEKESSEWNVNDIRQAKHFTANAKEFMAPLTGDKKEGGKQASTSRH